MGWVEKGHLGLRGAALGTDAKITPEAGCPAGRLYRECQPSEGCPFSCTHVTWQVGCFSAGCEEGCHCPVGTFQHRLSCVQVRTHSARSPRPPPPLPCLSSLSPAAAHPHRPCVTPGWHSAPRADSGETLPQDVAGSLEWGPCSSAAALPGSQLQVELSMTDGRPGAPSGSSMPSSWQSGSPRHSGHSREPWVLTALLSLPHPCGEAYPSLYSGWPQTPCLPLWGPDRRQVPTVLC